MIVSSLLYLALRVEAGLAAASGLLLVGGVVALFLWSRRRGFCTDADLYRAWSGLYGHRRGLTRTARASVREGRLCWLERPLYLRPGYVVALWQGSVAHYCPVLGVDGAGVLLRTGTAPIDSGCVCHVAVETFEPHIRRAADQLRALRQNCTARVLRELNVAVVILGVAAPLVRSGEVDAVTIRDYEWYIRCRLQDWVPRAGIDRFLAQVKSGAVRC